MLEGSVIVSASRREDLLSRPDKLVDRLRAMLHDEEGGGQARILSPLTAGDSAGGPVHTLCLWSKKSLAPLVRHPELRALLEEILVAGGQLYLLLSVTGLAGSFLELDSDPLEETLRNLGEILGSGLLSPRAVEVRFDPICEIIYGPSGLIGNMECGIYEGPLAAFTRLGVMNYRTSYIETGYKKIAGRFERLGLEFVAHSVEEKAHFFHALDGLVSSFDGELRRCVNPLDLELAAPHRGCIDGTYLARIHPGKRRCSTLRDRSQRYPHCFCTRSRDIGSYETCLNNCVYCYARPNFMGSLSRIEKEIEGIRADDFDPAGDPLYGPLLHALPYGKRK